MVWPLSAGHYYNRAWVISGGCLIWGVVTVGFSMARTLREGIFFWAFNGLGLALVRIWIACLECAVFNVLDFLPPAL